MTDAPIAEIHTTFWGTHIRINTRHIGLKNIHKIAWHELNDMSTASATSLIVIRRLSKIILFTALMFS